MDVIANSWMKFTILSVITSSLRGYGDEIPFRSQGQEILIYFLKNNLEAIMNLILDCIFFLNLVIRKIRAKFADHLISSTCGGINNMHWYANLTPRMIFLYMFSLISCFLFICWY